MIKLRQVRDGTEQRFLEVAGKQSPAVTIGSVTDALGRAGRLLLDRALLNTEPATPYRALALITQGRCGSTVLGLMLHQNPQIYWDGEALRPGLRPARWLRRLQGARGESGFCDLQALMPYARGRTYVFSSVGESLRYTTVSGLVEDLLALGFDRFAVLRRRNTLRKLVSVRAARQHAIWHLQRGRTAKLRQVYIPLTFSSGESLADRLRSARHWYEQADAALGDREVLQLEYETHIQPGPATAYRAVCDYLDIADTPATVRTERLNPFPLRSIISNFEEVTSVLRGTEWEWMLAE